MIRTMTKTLLIYTDLFVYSYDLHVFKTVFMFNISKTEVPM